MNRVKLGLLSLVCMVLFSSFADVAEAQLFKRFRERRAARTSSCSGSLDLQEQSYATPIRSALFRNRSTVASCSGSLQAAPMGGQVVSSCSGTVSYRLDTSSYCEDCSQTFALTEVSSTGVELQRTCVDGKCYLSPQSVMPTVTPTQLLNVPATKAFKPEQSFRVPVASSALFGLTELTPTKSVEIPEFVLAQVGEPKKTAKDSFRENLTKAIVDARKSDKISARDALKLRIAMLSPAFVENAHTLAVTQMAFSGETSEFVPVDANGVIQTEGINWDGLIKFMEALVPLLLTLLKAFGATA